MRDDPRFHDLEQMVEPQAKEARDERTKARMVVVPADWHAAQGTVFSLAEELRPKGRDLRLLVILTRALANQSQFAGLAEGLHLIAETINAYWDTLHPELRPSGTPREAATRRIAAVAQLQNKDEGLLLELRHLVLLAPRAVGPITGGELERAAVNEHTALAEAPGVSNSERASFAAAHEQLVNRVRIGCLTQRDQDPQAMTQLVEGARNALAKLNALDGALNARTGDRISNVPSLKTFLERVLVTLEQAVGGQATAANDAAAAAPGDQREAASPSAALNGSGAAPAGAAPIATGAMPDRLHSRDDVIKCLDLVIAFYDRTEPSSPIPHLVRRVRRMVPMDFLQLMEDLAPSGLKEFRTVAGVAEAKK